MENSPLKKHIVLFDGNCNVCHASVCFAKRHEGDKRFLFFPLQSDQAKVFFVKFNLPDNYTGSVLLIEEEKIFFKSTAVLRIIRRLSPVARLLYVFALVPDFLRDAVYDWFARNRNRWLGKEGSCVLPPE